MKITIDFLCTHIAKLKSLDYRDFDQFDLQLRKGEIMDSFLNQNYQSVFLRIFSKVLAISTLFLLFAGAMVTSTGSGLAVPDWPLSYGMVFPPMIGGVFYEHGHRLVATTVGFMTLLLSVSILFKESRTWVKRLGIMALSLVILQGLLGGLTVIFLLPTAVSVSHAVTGQTFFCVTIFLSYALSQERAIRKSTESFTSSSLSQVALLFVAIVYLQLILGAVMRHTHSGLAIPDFPTMGGLWLPTFDSAMLSQINTYLESQYLHPVHMYQVVFHFFHRVGAALVTVATLVLFFKGYRLLSQQSSLRRHLIALLGLVGIQIGMGIYTVLSQKTPWVASVHLMIGALILGLGLLFYLRIKPLKYE